MFVGKSAETEPLSKLTEELELSIIQWDEKISTGLPNIASIVSILDVIQIEIRM